MGGEVKGDEEHEKHRVGGVYAWEEAQQARGGASKIFDCINNILTLQKGEQYRAEDLPISYHIQNSTKPASLPQSPCGLPVYYIKHTRDGIEKSTRFGMVRHEE